MTTAAGRDRGDAGFVLWLTGLPCAGKSTLARLVASELAQRNEAVEVLDGDLVRAQWWRGLGFSKADRDENVRRIGLVSGLLSRHGVGVIVAVVSPYRSVRDEVRASVTNFIEVHVRASLDTCIRRDVKGMYRRALAGEITGFTGIDDPYEPPLAPELIEDTDLDGPAETAARILRVLEARRLTRSAPVSQQM